MTDTRIIRRHRLALGAWIASAGAFGWAQLISMFVDEGSSARWIIVVVFIAAAVFLGIIAVILTFVALFSKVGAAAAPGDVPHLITSPGPHDDHDPVATVVFNTPGRHEFHKSEHPGMTHAIITGTGGRGGDGIREPGKPGTSYTSWHFASELNPVSAFHIGAGGKGRDGGKDGEPGKITIRVYTCGCLNRLDLINDARR